jgi:predicted metalloprotease with PDZ domain
MRSLLVFIASCAGRHVRLVLALVLLPASLAFAQTAPTTYHVTVPEPEHHWLQVEAIYSGLGPGALKARMSRSSPGRYAVHEFAKNVFWVEAYNSKGQKLSYTRPDPYEWDVAGHDGTVRIVYRIFGDMVDGTYLAIDTTHAHMNIPATFMWAVGFDDKPVRVTFTAPAGSNWKVGTQLYPTSDPFTFTAPNLQYFMDSPTEFSNFVIATFSVPNADGKPANFRIVAHADASQADVNELAKLVERLVREQEAVYGEFPQYEPGSYTFLLDYMPWDGGDGMEHRNSTCITTMGASPGSNRGITLKTPQGRQQALDTISHEFFHNWNVERIRPVGLEPFDFRGANITCCLWLAEGFTQYYGPLLQARAGLAGRGLPFASPNQVINGSGRDVRSAVQMSEYAAFSDAARSIDPTDQSRTFISYYTYGAAIALGLDLSLREMSGGKTSLDDYMRLLWKTYGKPGGPAPGLVGKPYSLRDLRDRLADLTGNRKFADDFFDKYVEGRDVADYAHLLQQAGYLLRPQSPQAGWFGNVIVQVTPDGGLMVGVGNQGNEVPVPFGTPAYDAGLDAGDVIATIDDQPATMTAWNALRQKKPGDAVRLAIRRRDAATVAKTMTLKPNPTVEVVAVEYAGGTLTDAQKAFRESWFGTKVK